MTGVGARLRLRFIRVRSGRDQGTTLMELVVGMSLMTIFLGMFTGVVISMYSAQSKAESINNTSSQLNQSFLSLDKTVRYAAAISVPGRGADRGGEPGDWYVEFRTMNSGNQLCTQLRLDSTKQQLQERTWGVGTADPLSGWLPISSGIGNGKADVPKPGEPDLRPFVIVVDAAATFQRLRITLVAPLAKGSARTESTSSFTFTAINSAMPPPPSICTEAGRP